MLGESQFRPRDDYDEPLPGWDNPGRVEHHGEVHHVMGFEFAPAQSHMAKDSGLLAAWVFPACETGQVAKRTGLAMWVVKF